MLEELFNLVKGSATESVINNPDVPNEQNDAVVAEATNTVASGLQNMMAGGGLQNILSLFGGNGGQATDLQNNPIVNMMKGHFISKLTGKFNMESSQAGNVANSLIPDVLSKLVNNTNDPNNSSFDINSIIGSLTGGTSGQQSGGGFDFQNILSKFTSGGLDSNNDGQVGLDDIISKVTGGAQQQVRQQNSNSGSGIMDMIQGFLK